MCGIFGYHTNNADQLSKVQIKKVQLALEERGPDDFGISQSNEHIFLQLRLSILDLSILARQPMISSSGSTEIIFNGEIYNHLKLRDKLPNIDWKTSSDTETLLEYFEAFGLNKLLNDINGMFVIAFRMIHTGEIILIRDRLGIKPCYFINNSKNEILFSSTINALIQSGIVSASIDYDRIQEYLAFRYVLEENTFFKNIYTLPAGHYLTFSAGKGSRIEKYWELPSYVNSNVNEDDLVEELEYYIDEAVKLRMLSDVDVGSFLSGGVDSSLITALSKKYKNDINTYSVGYSGINEFYYSRKVRDSLGCLNREIIYNPSNVLADVDGMIKYKSAPLGVPNELMLSTMSSVLKKILYCSPFR
jgi:asparagine synthase (glutamine-hydrolysing)